ncbi:MULTISPECIES: hydantoinase/oxoprolinase family protein [Rhizobiaceae]|uniref:hydantoinase/oxoprolinase family protein n=1 Tax=Rhizobiaceae TaxID=82115 RepID=UPI0024126A64|nr:MULTISPECIES: hydantoinase/oxoprolinase family protein [Rhizobiaceae]MDG3580286.1 hydantoinase/oxoprolinase family protein [Rhizobium sp. YJ-22]
MRFATDTGGTFTDLVIERDGRLHLFKSPTVPSNPVEGVLGAFSVAAEAFGMERQALLAQGHQFIHGTTHAINAIITKRVAKTALLVTKGHPDILLLREGGREKPFDHSVRYPRAFIPRALTHEIPGRIIASGTEIDALDEAAVLATIERLKADGVEAVAVCLLWSVVNPAHELRVAELLEEHLPGVPFTLSHRLNPSLREYRRAIATSIDASLKPLMDRYIGGLTGAMREAGFNGQVLVLTSQGSMVDADEIRRSPILALNSGPSMAPIAGSYVAEAESELQDAIIFDTGGTTFDVSLVRGGRVPFTHETWLGRPYQSDLTGFPSIDVKSVGAGGGSIAWVDDGGVLHVGPQSAGSVPGPACYGAGGEEPTVTDATLVLGYIDPDFFLGGRIRLDIEKSRRVITEKVAKPLGLTMEEAASAMLDVWTENMVQAIADITVNQGIDPSAASIIGGGGAAGLNAVAIATRMGCPELIIPEVGAGLSAAGAVVSEVGRSFRRLFVTNTQNFDHAGVEAKLAELSREAADFAAQAGVSGEDTRIDFFVEARYAHQVWEIDVAIDPETLRGEGAVEALRQAFHQEHERIFAFRDADSMVEAIAWRAQVSCRAAETTNLRIAATAEETAISRKRQAYFAGLGWSQVPVHGFSTLPEGEELAGPAIVESRFTSVVINPGAAFKRSVDGNLVIRPQAAQAQVEPLLRRAV